MASKASGQVTVVDVTDAYSVLLTSEAYTFIGNTAGAPSGLSCTTQVVAYCGAQQCSSVSISTVTCPTGISATISNNNTVSPTITFKTTATITEACEATIPVVVDEVTINKKFSFAVAKQGTQGNTGATGKGISSVTPQYYISTSKTSATGGSWSDTAPTTIEKGKYLWTRMKVVYTNPSSTEYTTATYDSMTDSRIEQLKDSITLSVTDGSVGNTAKIKLGIDDETKEASIDLTGAVTFTDLSTAGSTTINGSNITTGTVSADRINVEELMAQHLTSTGGLDVTGKFFVNNEYGGIIQTLDNEFPYTAIYNTKITTDHDAQSSVSVGPQSVTILSKDLPLSESYTDGGNSMLRVSNAITLQTSKDVNIIANQGIQLQNDTTVSGDLSITGNITAGNLESGTWTPTIYGATVNSYTAQQGWYLKIGNVVAIGWYLYAKFASNQTSNKYRVSGAPYTPSQTANGGGACSGYYSANQVNFSGWMITKAGIIYANGVTNGAAGNKWNENNIYCGTGDSSSSGTIIYCTSTT